MSKLSYLFMKSFKPDYISYVVNTRAPSTIGDWNRYTKLKDRDTLFINGYDMVGSIHQKKVFDDKSFDKFLNDEFIIELQLHVKSDAAKKLREYLKSILHQGGAMTVMQTALVSEAGKKYYSPIGLQSTIHLGVKNGAIYIKERVTVPELKSAKDNSSITKSGRRPLLVADAVQRITVSESGKISHTVTKSTLGFQSSRAKAVIDTRSVLKRIADAVTFMYTLFVAIKVKVQKPVEPVVTASVGRSNRI